MRIAQTYTTPGINFSNGELNFNGRLILENTQAFCEPLFEEIKSYLEDPLEKTDVYINMDYVNTSSSKVLLNILKLLYKVPNFSVEWTYEKDDNDIKKLGKLYEKLLKIKFKFIEKK